MAGHGHDPGPIAWGQQDLQDFGARFVGEHAQHPMAPGLGSALVCRAPVQLQAQNFCRRRVVGPIQQEVMAAPGELLQAPRPAGLGKTGANGAGADGPAPLREGVQHAQGHGPIAGLDGAGDAQDPWAQIQGFHPAQLGAAAGGPLLEHGSHLRALGRAQGGAARLEHPGFFGGNGGCSGPKKLAVIKPDRAKADHAPIGMAGGGIEPAPQPHFQHHQGAARFCKGAKGGSCHQLEGGELVALAQALQRQKLVAQGRFADRIFANADPLAPTHQMGGGVEARLDAGGQQAAVHQGGDRALAVGARHLNGRELALGMAQLGEGGLEPIQAEVDPAAAERFDQICKGICKGISQG